MSQKPIISTPIVDIQVVTMDDGVSYALFGSTRDLKAFHYTYPLYFHDCRPVAIQSKTHNAFELGTLH